MLLYLTLYFRFGMSRPWFLSGLLDLYDSVIGHADDRMIIITHWIFTKKEFRVIEQQKVKAIYKTNLFCYFLLDERLIHIQENWT